MQGDSTSLVSQCVAFTKCIDTGSQMVLRLIRRLSFEDRDVQKKLDRLMHTIGQFHGYAPDRTEACGVHTSPHGTWTNYVDASGLESHHPLLDIHRNEDGHFILAWVAHTYALTATQDALHLVYRIQLDVYSHQLLDKLVHCLALPAVGAIRRAYKQMEQLKRAARAIVDRFTQVSGNMRAERLYQSVVDLHTSGLGLLHDRHALLSSVRRGHAVTRDEHEDPQSYLHICTPQYVSIVTEILTTFADNTTGLRMVLAADTAIPEFQKEWQAIRSLYPFSSYVERLAAALPAFIDSASRVETYLDGVERYREVSYLGEKTYQTLMSGWIYCMSTIHTTHLEMLEHSTVTDVLWSENTSSYRDAAAFVQAAERRFVLAELDMWTCIAYDSYTAFHNLRCMLEYNYDEPQHQWVTGAHMEERGQRGHKEAFFSVLEDPETGKYTNGPIFSGPYPDLHFQEIFPVGVQLNTSGLPTDLWAVVTQYDARLRVVRPVTPRAIRQRYMPLYNTPVVWDPDEGTERLSMFKFGEHTSLSVAAALLRGPNMHPQNVEAFRRIQTTGDPTPLPPGCLLFTSLPDTFNESTLRPGTHWRQPEQSHFFLDPVAALHSTENHSAHRGRASYWDHPDRPTTEAYILAMRHVPLVVYKFEPGSLPQPELAAIPDRRAFRPRVSEVLLVEGTTFESTVEWDAIVDIGFMGTDVCPFGSHGVVDFCRLIVCNARVVPITST